MDQIQGSSSIWKIAISLLVAAAFCSILVELFYSIEPMASGQVGSLGATFQGLLPKHPSKIDSLQPDSPLAAAGAVVGDTVILDPSKTLFNRAFQIGEPVGLTLVHGTVSKHLVVVAIAEPMSFISYFHKISDMVVSAVAGLFTLLLVYKIPDLKTYRALTLFFLFQALNCDFKFAPTGTLHILTDITSWGTALLIPYFCFRFVLFYPDDRPQGLRVGLVRMLPAISWLTAVSTAMQLWRLSLDHDITNFGRLAFQCYYLFFLILIMAALLDGYRHSAANGRQKFLWLAISLCVPFILSVSSIIVNGGGPTERSVFTIVYEATLLLMEIGTVYAVLKHRVFNFSFALNRAIFYSASTLLLLIGFGIIEWLFDKVVHIEGRESNVLIDGAIALCVYLIFHKIRHYLEHWLERVFFHAWHVNETKLREFIRTAAHITAEGTLLQALYRELKRFSGGGSCAIFLRDGAGDYALVGTTDADACQRIVVDNPVCVLLRADLKPILAGNDLASFTRHTIFPMAHRGTLDGIVLIGEKTNGEEFRPDEIDLLSHAIRQVGLDLYALRIERLENSNRDLQRDCGTMRQLLAQISGKPAPVAS